MDEGSTEEPTQLDPYAGPLKERGQAFQRPLAK
jgi:hypothetical protein